MNIEKVMNDTLNYIEEKIDNKITVDDIAAHVYVSSTHLQRLFNFMFNEPIAEYVRARKMQKSLELIYNTHYKLVDIATELGFAHESSYIRTFKKTFGYSPNEVRKNHYILPIIPMLTIPKYEELERGQISGIEHVMLPQLDLIGRKEIIPFDKSLYRAPEAAKSFWDNDAKTIKGKLNDHEYIGLTQLADKTADYSYYTPSVIVKAGTKPPEGLVSQTLKATMGVRFKYIGYHHYYDINREMASEMYEKIYKFMLSKEMHTKYTIPLRYYYEKIDTADYDGKQCLMEWVTPVKINKIS